jgi:hypothetical protein
MKNNTKQLLAVLALGSFAPLVHAGEELFPETYLADTLPKGVFEVEQGTTYREGKSEGTYQLWESRTEIEYGVTDKWLIAGYVNGYSVEAQNDNSAASRVAFTSGGGDGDEISGGGPGTFGAYVPNASKLPIPAAKYKKTDYDSVSFETIYRILSPYTDPVGLAAYFEYTQGPNGRELEFKALLQKNYLEDRLVLAANAVIEVERNEYNDINVEKETEYELTGGASYRFAENWRAGAEMRNIRGYNGHSFDSDDRSYSVWYAGPQVSYTAMRFFATLGYQRQLPWAQAYDSAAKLEQVSGLNYKEFEANFMRLKFGVNFK